MTSIVRALQQEVFQPNEERLITCCHVGKYLKKKKTSFLCLVSTTSPPINISIVQVKQTDKQSHKRKRSWALAELKGVDGRNESSETQEFDLHFDKVYRWVATNPKERHSFIHNLWKQAVKHIMKDMPTFKNVPQAWITEDAMTPENKFVSSPLLGDTDLTEDFQAITDKEQEDLKRLMSGCEFAISNAEAFMEILARDLSLLDGENVQCVLASEEQVETLMGQLEVAINEADRLETQLDSYDEILCHVRDTMEKMEKKNSLISVVDKNNQLLLRELENIVTRLDLPKRYQDTLEDADFTTPQGLKAAVEAGNALKIAMNSDIDKALLQMTAVQEQRRRFEKYKEKFSRSICRQLNNLFIHYGNHKGESDKTVEGLILPQHSGVHKELTSYVELMHWIKVMDRKSYESLKTVYTNSLGKLYERDLKNLFELAKAKVAAPGLATSPTTLIGLDRDMWTLETNSNDRKNYKATLEQVLTQLEPVCLQEQQFCVNFFQLDVLTHGSKNTLTTLDGPAPETESVVSPRKAEKQINEDVRNMMSSLFSCLKSELDSLIDHIKRQDNFYCMYVLVCLNQHVMSAQSSFLSNTFASELIEVKRSLDQFMQMQIDSVKECRVARKSKCGILPYVSNIEEFAINADCLLKSDRRADLEKWYTRLVDTILEYISIHSNEHHKTPPQVIKMENYHHLYSLLSQLKISVLDAQRKEAKQKYNDALQAYVTLYFGRPLEKLNTFFEGVQARVASGVKASEVSYQLAFSKQELRKVINQYPGSTVKKGLEALYKKVEKHLSEEGNLLQVVWRAMQEEFIRQYKMLEDLIQQCYPGSMISLEFTIEDILHFFSDIARSH
ncbi:exocyst complex component 1 [Tribolium castaneum]|uniref:exocyst complex component 1 n=1 Tax=Tribolium castaneum TaxID=7070 RepID=UPI0000D55729|nr:PREDICTED: exocyst complex component 1 [Tribolium castaneum]|eukprot:XP_969314.1 PREDICTED: exocyst complex component 1 [Tribolium castaneum]